MSEVCVRCEINIEDGKTLCLNCFEWASYQVEINSGNKKKISHNCDSHKCEERIKTLEEEVNLLIIEINHIKDRIIELEKKK